MEPLKPKQDLKKHNFTKPKWEISMDAWRSHLMVSLNQISQEIHEQQQRGTANYMVVGSSLTDYLPEWLNVSETTDTNYDYEWGQPHLEDNRLVLDVNIYPRQTIQNIELDFTVTSAADTPFDIIMTTDTWTNTTSD